MGFHWLTSMGYRSTQSYFDRRARKSSPVASTTDRSAEVRGNWKRAVYAAWYIADDQNYTVLSTENGI